MAGSAHDGRKKSIMQTLPILPLRYPYFYHTRVPILPLPSLYNVMQTLPILAIQCYAESARSAIQCYTIVNAARRNQGDRGRLRGWAIWIASPFDFMRII